MENESWGLRPVLFTVGKYPVDSYAVFMLLALVVAIAAYMIQLRKDGIRNSNSQFIALFAITGGTIGAKLPIIFIYWNQLSTDPSSINILLSGRTIVGGLIGGASGTFLAKKIFGIKERLGNQLAIPVALGMAIGRLGCLCRGCCYGTPTSLPWGLDFGDHSFRHPTQAYEIIFDLALVFVLIRKKNKNPAPGTLFTFFLNSYLAFRFLLEFIRVEDSVFLGLTAFQLICVASLMYINRRLALASISNSKKEKL